MPASPAPAKETAQPKADRYIVLLGGKNGQAPTLNDECEWLVPVSVSLSMGAARLDTFQCRVDLGRGGKRIQDTTTPVGFRRQIELRRLDADGNPTDIVTWGMLASDGQNIGVEERETVTARLDSFLFGTVLKETNYWDPLSASVVYVNLPAVLNPTIDEIFCPNMSDRKNADRGTSALFYHPESHRLEPSSSFQGQTAMEWTFKDAVHWLCWNLNKDQQYIINPTLNELEPVFATEAGYARIRNFELKYGRSLPQLLDDLLNPFGFAWNLVHTINKNGVRETRFRFFERGKGPAVKLLMQPVGETISTRTTNLHNFSLDYDIARLANTIIGQGAMKLIESTFQLYPAWDPADDDTDVEYLATGHPQNVAKRDIGRKYVANEARDYSNLRPWIAQTNLTSVIGANHVVRRRRFKPCVSWHTSTDDETTNGYILEWWDADETDAVTPSNKNDPGWVKVKHPFQILEKECGIMFTGTTPPVDDFLQMIIKGKEENPETQPLFLRITCSIEADEALTYTATRRDSSPNGLDVPLFLDVKDRFQFRDVKSTSKFDGTPADKKDDLPKLTTYIDRVRNNNDQAEVSVGVTLLTSNHPEYKIGYLVTKVDGRNLTFNANSDAATPRPLQIVGINRSLDGEQHTELLLESFELEKRELQVQA